MAAKQPAAPAPADVAPEVPATPDVAAPADAANTTEEVKKVHVNCILNEVDDAAIVQKYRVIQRVAAPGNKRIFELGLDAFRASPDWKKAVDDFKALMGSQ